MPLRNSFLIKENSPENLCRRITAVPPRSRTSLADAITLDSETAPKKRIQGSAFRFKAYRMIAISFVNRRAWRTVLKTQNCFCVLARGFQQAGYTSPLIYRQQKKSETGENLIITMLKREGNCLENARETLCANIYQTLICRGRKAPAKTEYQTVDSHPKMPDCPSWLNGTLFARNDWILKIRPTVFPESRDWTNQR